MRISFGPLLLFPLFLPSVVLAIPEWAKDYKGAKSEKQIEVICAGDGPSVELAKREAINACISEASKRFQSTWEIKTLSVETEKTAAYHQEISENKSIDGLTCDLKRQTIEEQNGLFQAWLLCAFDLSKAKVSSNKSSSPDNSNRTDAPTSNVRNEKELKTIKTTAGTNTEVKGPSIGKRTLLLVSAPKCESVIVRGFKPRSFDCQSNPLQITLFEGDEAIIVRARGFKAKTVYLASKGPSEEVVEVLLERIQ